MKYNSCNKLNEIISRKPKWILSFGFYIIFIFLVGIMYMLSTKGLPILDFLKNKITLESGMAKINDDPKI